MEQRLESYVKLMSKNSVFVVRMRNGKGKRKRKKGRKRKQRHQNKVINICDNKKIKQRYGLLVNFVKDVYSFKLIEYLLGGKDLLMN
jgi:hypothetical protein